MSSFTIAVSVPLLLKDCHVHLKSSSNFLDGELLVQAVEGLIEEHKPGEIVILVAAELQAFNIDPSLHEHLSQMMHELEGGDQGVCAVIPRLRQLLRDPLAAVSDGARHSARQAGVEWIQRNYGFITHLRQAFQIKIHIVTWHEFIAGATEPTQAFLDEIVDAMHQSISLHAQWPCILQGLPQQQHRIPSLKTINFLSTLHGKLDRHQALPENLNAFWSAQDEPAQEKLNSALERFRALPGWTLDIFRQAYRFEKRTEHKKGESVAAVKHLVSQLYVLHETVWFLMAAQRTDTDSYCVYWYPCFDFPVLRSLGNASLSLKHLRVVPTWKTFEVRKRSELLTLSCLQDTYADEKQGLLSMAISPKFEPLRSRKCGPEARPLRLEDMDGVMTLLYLPMLGSKQLKEQPLSDYELIGCQLLSNIFEEHDKIAMIEGSWSGHEPVFICHGNMLKFLHCHVEKRAFIDDGIVTLICSSRPLSDKLMPLTDLPLSHHAREAPAGFTLGGFLDVCQENDEGQAVRHPSIFRQQSMAVDLTRASGSRHSARARTRQRERVRRAVRTPSP